MAGLLEQVMQQNLSVAKRLNKTVERNFKSGARVLFSPDGKLEISRAKGVTMIMGEPVKPWETEVKTFAKHAGYEKFDLFFTLDGVATVTPL